MPIDRDRTCPGDLVPRWFVHLDGVGHRDVAGLSGIDPMGRHSHGPTVNASSMAIEERILYG